MGQRSAADELDGDPLELDPSGEGGESLDLDGEEGGPKTNEGGEELDVEIIDDPEPDTSSGTDGGDPGDPDAGDAGDAGDPGAEDEDGVSPEDKKTFSKDVQERIKREVRLRKRVVEEAEGRAHAEMLARVAAERRALEFEVGMATMADSKLEGDIKTVTAELIAAKEAGETSKEVELQQKLNDLQGKRREVQNGKKIAEERLEKVKEAPADGRPADGLRPITKQWMGRNKWFGAKGFEAYTAAAKVIDAEMAKEGRLSPDDPRYYAEFDRRIHRDMPNLRQRLKKDAPRPKPPVLGPTRPASRGGEQRGKITLTRSQLENMRAFGLDPNNKQHLIEYAKSVRGQQ